MARSVLQLSLSILTAAVTSMTHGNLVFDRMSRDQKAQDTNSSTTSTLQPTTAYRPLYSISHSQELETTQSFSPQASTCRRLMLQFAYRENMCRARSVSEYLESSRSIYSCLRRCGAWPKFQGVAPECACDDKCLIYKDCCRDMLTVCPGDYQKARVLYEGFPHIEMICKNDENAMVSRCGESDLIPHQEYFESSTVSIDYYNSETSLNEFSIHHYLHPVIDLSTGILFENYYSFLSCRREHMVPEFVHRRMKLGCRSKTQNGDLRTGKYSILVALTQCYPIDLYEQDFLNYARRPCQIKTTLSCKCDDHIVDDYIHNACLGTNASAQELAGIPFGESGQDYVFSVLVENNQCEKSSGVVGRKYNLLTLDPRSHETKISLHPVLQREINTNASYPTIPSGSVSYLLQTSWTLEKRLRCRNLRTKLKTCQIEECADWAMLVSAKDIPTSFQDERACIFPDMVRVTWQRAEKPLPLCICLKVITAISKLGRWSVKARPGLLESCWIKLEPIMPANSLPVDTHTATELPKPDLLDFLERELELDSTATDELICPDQPSRPQLTLCFFAYSDESGDTSLRESVKCIKTFETIQFSSPLDSKSPVVQPTAFVLTTSLFIYTVYYYS